MIPLCVPEIRGNEWTYVKECLDTNWVSSVGSYVNRFEEMLAARVDQPYAVATVNGTSALHTALIIAGVEAGDEVIVPALTFIAPANAVRYTGAWPVFIDVEADYWQIDPEKLRRFLEEECEVREGATVRRATGKRVRAMIPVHILGHPVDMDPLLELARQYHLKVIEDATESLGARYRDRMVGSMGDMACFSFNGNKLITTGGGGMLVTADKNFADRARYLTQQAKDDPLEYEHNEIGYNYRLTNVAAAMGCAQMEQLDDYIAAKRKIAARYDEAFAGTPGIACLPRADWGESVAWLYTVLIDEAQVGIGSRELLKYLSEEKIQTRPLWKPLPGNKPFEDLGFDCPVADDLYRKALSLPCSVGLRDDDQQRVIDAVLGRMN